MERGAAVDDRLERVLIRSSGEASEKRCGGELEFRARRLADSLGRTYGDCAKLCDIGCCDWQQCSHLFSKYQIAALRRL